MTKIETIEQYEWAEARIEQLLPLVDDDTPSSNPYRIELELLSNLVADYSDKHFAIGNPPNEEGTKFFYAYDYPRPAVTADCVVMTNEPFPRVLLIQRGGDPYKGSWAFPGGFMNMDETIEQCAIRELEEETNLKVKGISLIGVYSKVDRDPRGRTITMAYLAIVDSPEAVIGQDDAAKAEWFPINNLPKLAFDHSDIMKDAIKVYNQNEKEESYTRLLAEDVDWDYSCLIALEKKKLQRMHDCIKSESCLEHKDFVVRDIAICIRLIDIFMEEDSVFLNWLHKSFSGELKYTKVGDNLYELDGIDEQSIIDFPKYVNVRNEKRFFRSTPIKDDLSKGNRASAILSIPELRQLKALHLYHLIREYKLFEWWC